MADLTGRQQEVFDLLRQGVTEKTDLAHALGITESTIHDHVAGLRGAGVDVVYSDGQFTLPDDDTDTGGFVFGDAPGDPPEDTDTEEDSADPEYPTLTDTTLGEDPDPNDVTDRERVILSELETGTTVDELTERLDERASIVTEHLRDLRRSGWQVYVDETAEHITIEGDTTLRSSEHKGTRTRKANQWWELRHNALVRSFKALDPPTISSTTTADGEDWVTHLTDLHAGDEVRGYADSVIHCTEDLPAIVDYITEKSLALADKHNARYDTAYLLWGGDMVTNEAIYSGQFEDLDEWLDGQIDIMHDPLLRQVKAFARRFDTVRVVCTPGNHGEIRASGSSKQANADLILYKGIRNTVAALQAEGLLDNVGFQIGRAGTVTPFEMRDGKIHAQLRHGQDRSPQADTSARKKEWLSTLLDSENYGTKFDVAYMGHHHVSGRLPWNGPPVIITGTPKPAGEYPRELGETVGPSTPKIATCHGVADEGLTSVWPIDTRDFEPSQ